QEILVLRGPGTQQFFSVALAPKGRRLAAAGQRSNTLDQAVLLWDATRLTAELLDEREARSAVAFWFGKGMARAKVSAHLREEASLRDGVRTRALALVEPYEECRVRAEAEQVIRSLFSKPMLQSEVLERLQADTVLGERVRRAAVVLAEQFVDHAPA